MRPRLLAPAHRAARAVAGALTCLALGGTLGGVLGGAPGLGAGAAVLLGMAALGGAVGAVVLVRRARRAWPRRCPNGHGPMTRLDARAAVAALTSGQRAEARLGSVAYDVWACTVCDARAVVAYPRRWAGYAACPRCAARTGSTHTAHPPGGDDGVHRSRGDDGALPALRLARRHAVRAAEGRGGVERLERLGGLERIHG